MTISRVIAFREFESFADPHTHTVNVGTGSFRAAAVWAGWISQSTMTPPASITIGTDTLTATGAQQTGPGSGTDKYQLYTGTLTVTGSQTITVNYDGTASSGGAIMVGEVFQGSVGDLSFGTPAFLDAESGSSGAPTAPSVTAGASDKVCLLVIESGGATISAVSPAVLSADLSPNTFQQSAVRDGAGGSTSIGVSFSAAYGVIGAAVPITESGGGGGGSSIAVISHMHRMQ